MGRLRCYAVIGAILMALGTVSCSGSSPETAATSVLGSGCVGCPYVHPSLAQAKTEFEKAVKADPNNRYDWYDLGVIAQSSGDTRTAQADFLRAIAIDPKFESALYGEGLLRFRADDRSGAITYLSRAVTQNAKNSCAHWALGYALRSEGGPPAAKRATAQLRAALKIDPAFIKGIDSPKVKPNTVPGCS
jgi:tetratricopeptide (TPR) repeat protein